MPCQPVYCPIGCEKKVERIGPFILKEDQMPMINKILVILILLPITTFAADINDLNNGVAASYTQLQRKQLAVKLNELLTTLDRAIPSSKPSEQQWVDDEQKAIKEIKDDNLRLKRFIDFEKSAEYQQYNIKRHIKILKVNLNGVTKANDVKNEIYYWAKVSYDLTDKSTFDFAIAILKSNNRLPSDVNGIYLGGNESGGGYFYNSFGRAIINYFVIPYLDGSLPK
jgi:hypothetical protein